MPSDPSKTLGVLARHGRDVAKVIRCSADDVAGYEDVVHLSCTEESITGHSPEAVVLTCDLGRQRTCAGTGGPDYCVRLDAFPDERVTLPAEIEVTAAPMMIST